MYGKNGVLNQTIIKLM